MTTWHKGKPTESGNYVTISKYNLVMNLPYSNKHKLWNAYDYQTNQEAISTAIAEENIKYYCDLQEFINEVERQE